MFIIPFLSCSTEEEPAVAEYNLMGEWVLVQTSGQVPDSEETGEDMPFQETYTVNEDGSFTKTRITEGEEKTATGTYEVSETTEVINDEEVKLVYFVHESESLLATCSSSTLTEDLYLTPDGKLISLYMECDGIGLQYEKLDQEDN